MRLGISVSGNSMRDKVELAKMAEEAGFESVFTNDDPGQDVFVSLALLAANTERVKIGSGICRAFIRNPAVTASAAQDIDELSNGRMILGLGTGTKRQNLYQYGIEVKAAATMLREAVDIMRQIWRNRGGTPLQYEGKYWNIQQPRYSDAFAISDHVTTWFASVNAVMTQLMGEVADGSAGHPCWTPKYIKDFVLPNLEKGLAKGGRTRKDFTLGRWVTACISDEEPEQAKLNAKLSMGNYLATRSYGGLLDFHGWTKEKEAIQDAFFNKKDMTAVRDAVTDEIVHEMSIYGTTEQARKHLEYHAPHAEVTILMPGAGSRSDPRSRYDVTKNIIDTCRPLLKG